MLRRVHPLILTAVFIAVAILVAGFGPRERSLGVNVRLVYLHGAWVWTALLGFAAAAVAGLAGLLFRRLSWQRLSIALGQAATLFWITYLPMSLLVMQANWNGLFLEEPRFRIGLDFAIIALLLQAGVLLLDRPAWASAVNIVFVAGLAFSLASSREIMHPSSPIASSGWLALQAYFAGLTLTCVAAGSQVARWLHRRLVA
jgi:hypothetical protein